MATSAIERWKYFAALPLTILCLAIGNLLGVILASLWGWEGVKPGQPGTVLLGFIQGYAGALIAMTASDYFLKSTAPGDLVIKWIVRVVAAVTVIIAIWALAVGHYDLVFAWSPLAALTCIVGTEFGRRVHDQL